MKTQNNKTNRAVPKRGNLTQELETFFDAVRESDGRFFGILTKNGSIHNAQFVRETPHAIRIRDRNSRREYTIRKKSVVAVSYRGLIRPSPLYAYAV